MSRIRTIKPELFKHEDLFDAEEETGLPLRLAFIGLFTQCDREGRFRWRPRQLKTDIMPYDDIDFSRVLDALASRGFLVKYGTTEGDLGCIPSWSKHQFINPKEKASDLPSPEEGWSQPIENVSLSDASPTRAERVVNALPRVSIREGEGEREQERKEQTRPPAGGGAPEKNSPIEESPPPPPITIVRSTVEPEADLEIPGHMDRRAYPPEFEELWREYRPIAAPNATKADACKSWERLSAQDRQDCWTGVVRYVVWLGEERKRRSDTPAKHLSTFINRRGWEPFIEAEMNRAS